MAAQEDKGSRSGNTPFDSLRLITAITLAEMWFGAAKSNQPRRTRSDQDAFLAPFRVLDFDTAAADCYASIRADLTAKGRPIGDRDLMIAAIARANRLVVVTSNVGEFARVPKLKVEDWMV
ncbi:MAG TPA: type II toxin-antitoxin system VapC family toxin [Polyangia bacterium]